MPEVIAGGHVVPARVAGSFAGARTMLQPFDFEPVLVRKPPALFGNRLQARTPRRHPLKNFLKTHPRWAAGIAALVLAVGLAGISPETSKRLFTAVGNALATALSGGSKQ